MKKENLENVVRVHTRAHTGNFKNRKGITLVALVITIVILLILAGISISQLTGSGLFEKAKLAKEKSENAQEKEEGILNNYNDKIQTILGNRDINFDYSEYIDILKFLYSNAGEYVLPKTIEELVNSQSIFEGVLKSKENAEYIISNPNTFRELIVKSQSGMRALGNNEYASYLAISNSEWREKILQSDYIDEFNIGAKTVPVMTSETTPKGEAFASNSTDAYGGDGYTSPHLCFDGDNTTGGMIARPYTLNGYIGYKFTEQVMPYYVSILNYDRYSNYFSNIKIQGSNDNENWIDLTGVTSVATSGWSHIKLDSENSYQKYQYLRILQTTDKGAPYFAGAYTIQFYCR